MALLDTLVALIAGLIIFPIVFSNGLEPGAGPGLIFQTLPIAFGSLPAGNLIGAVFFVLVLVAAWTSAISIAEPAVAWAVEKGFSRIQATVAVCGLAWLIGIGTVLSFNVISDKQVFVQVKTLDSQGEVLHSELHWYADVAALKASLPVQEERTYQVEGKTFFGMLDFLTSNIMMPLGGMLIALFAGWFMTRKSVADESRLQPSWLLSLWRFMLRVVSPLAIFYIFISGLL